MTQLLQRAFEKAAALPEDKQNDFAQRALEELESDQKWDALFADPRSERALELLAAEAMLEIERGETEDFDAVLDEHDEKSNN